MDRGVMGKLAIGLMALPLFQAPGCLAAGGGNVERGRQVFEKQTCALCHPHGENVLVRRKPLKGAVFIKEFPNDRKLELLIRSGVKGTAMPAFDSAKISDRDMRDLIAYIRSLTPPAK